ncbi:MAG: EAL domain-containing protein, partial [Desulfovibrio sp.]|nr:EAL domain-containing protein [Desulfovibrio sp.]
MTEPSEQQLLSAFDDAIEKNDIFPLYQAQIDHSTGYLVGAEALMRWRYEGSYLSPALFIPLLEKNDLIFRADLHLFDIVCAFQRKCLDEGIPVVPISVNMSRYDIFRHSYVKHIEAVRKRHDVPVKYLRIEITESSAIGGMKLMKQVLGDLHSCGYLVEMDDFGSGYSSLNILKDLDVDIIKLDMNFLNGKIGGRGGIIISSVVQMAKWLDTPLIAEGVETEEQADFMKSIGCNYIQGFIYSKPESEENFIRQIQTLHHEPLKPAMHLLETINAGKFWNPDSIETLIFS